MNGPGPERLEYNADNEFLKQQNGQTHTSSSAGNNGGDMLDKATDFIAKKTGHPQVRLLSLKFKSRNDNYTEPRNYRKDIRWYQESISQSDW